MSEWDSLYLLGLRPPRYTSFRCVRRIKSFEIFLINMSEKYVQWKQSCRIQCEVLWLVNSSISDKLMIAHSENVPNLEK